MRLVLLAGAGLLLVGCAYTRHEFELSMPAHVTAEKPVQPNVVGRSHHPYTGKPKYLAEARPMLPTTSGTRGDENPCAKRSAACDDRLRALLASVDGQILALSSPPTDVQLAALRLDLAQVQPLLAPYPDITAERDELAALVDKLPSMTPVDQGTARKRMIELDDLIRVQLAAAQ